MARRSSWYIASERYHDAGRPRGGSCSGVLDEIPKKSHMFSTIEGFDLQYYCYRLNQLEIAMMVKINWSLIWLYTTQTRQLVRGNT